MWIFGGGKVPYIEDKEKRKILNKMVDDFLGKLKVHGNLNYFLFKLCKEAIKQNGESYGRYKEFIGELEMFIQEIDKSKKRIYDELAYPYECKKRLENGDVP